MDGCSSRAAPSNRPALGSPPGASESYSWILHRFLPPALRGPPRRVTDCQGSYSLLARRQSRIRSAANGVEERAGLRREHLISWLRGADHASWHAVYVERHGLCDPIPFDGSPFPTRRHAPARRAREVVKMEGDPPSCRYLPSQLSQFFSRDLQSPKVPETGLETLRPSKEPPRIINLMNQVPQHPSLRSPRRICLPVRSARPPIRQIRLTFDANAVEPGFKGRQAVFHVATCLRRHDAMRGP